MQMEGRAGKVPSARRAIRANRAQPAVMGGPAGPAEWDGAGLRDPRGRLARWVRQGWLAWRGRWERRASRGQGGRQDWSGLPDQREKWDKQVQNILQIFIYIYIFIINIVSHQI